MGLFEKTLEDDGYYAIKLDNNLLFRAADNETIAAFADMIKNLSNAGDYATLSFENNSYCNK